MDQKQRGNPSEAEGFMDGIGRQNDGMTPGYNRDSNLESLAEFN
jgi:hypothetical protein